MPMKKGSEEKKKTVPKILRLGIVRAGRFVEERLMRKPKDVTIGTSEKATFMVPLEGFPESFKLFWYRKGKYYLCFTKKMQGKLSINGEIFNLAQIATSNFVKQSKGYLFMPLDENSRGKLKFGDVSLLFQFIDPPKPLPKYQLPASVRGGILTNIDSKMFISLGISLGVHIAFVAFAFWWQGHMITHLEENHIYSKAFELLKTEVEMEQKKKPIVVKTNNNAGKGKKKAAPAPAPVRHVRKVAHRHHRRGGGGIHKISAAAHRKKLLASVRSNSVIKYLGAMGKDGIIKGATVKSGATMSALKDAFGSKTGVKAAKAGTGLVGYKGGPKTGVNTGAGSYKGLSNKEIGGPIKTGKVGRVVKSKNEEVAVRLRIGGHMGSQIGGKIDAHSVERLFRRKQSAIKICYERILKTNPNIHGKITLIIVIGLSGQVQSVMVRANETGNSRLAACVISRVRSWHFPRPKGSPVTVMYPLLFQKM